MCKAAFGVWVSRYSNIHRGYDGKGRWPEGGGDTWAGMGTHY